MHDPKSWNMARPGIQLLVRVPDWLGGHRTVRWIMRRKWRLWCLWYGRKAYDWLLGH